jgi:hypothetical protein
LTGPRELRMPTWPSHVLAGGLALAYAFWVSRTTYFTSALQFVSPVIVVLLTHLAWMTASGALHRGFAEIALRRTLVTAIILEAAIVLAALAAPMPIQARADFLPGIGMMLALIACLAVVALVLFVVATVAYIVIRFVLRMIARLRSRAPGSDDGRLNDFGAITIVLLVVGVASLEGVPQSYSFSSLDHASSKYLVDAPPAAVWRAVGKATSPQFALPAFLRSIPQPVAVLVDEGADLGSRRIVHFAGREGEGDLTLQVVKRSEEEAVFQAVSDTSPIAHWVRQKELTFRIETVGPGSRLTVSLDYDRRLSPAWFFGPYIRLAAFMAVDVLARDTAERAR